MPLFAPQQIQGYVRPYAQQGDNLPSRQTIQSVGAPTEIKDPQDVPEKKGLPWGYKAGMIGTQLFDGASTRAALGNNKNAIESNPLMAPLAGNTSAFLGAKAGMGLLQSYALNNLAKEHPKAARIASLLSMAIPTIAGASNLSKAR